MKPIAAPTDKNAVVLVAARRARARVILDVLALQDREVPHEQALVGDDVERVCGKFSARSQTGQEREETTDGVFERPAGIGTKMKGWGESNSHKFGM